MSNIIFTFVTNVANEYWALVYFSGPEIYFAKFW